MLSASEVTDKLVGASKAIAALVGSVLALLTYTTGLGVFHGEAATWAASAIAVLTGVAAYFAPYAPAKSVNHLVNKGRF